MKDRSVFVRTWLLHYKQEACVELLDIHGNVIGSLSCEFYGK